jgi:hypothetical protein
MHECVSCWEPPLVQVLPDAAKLQIELVLKLRQDTVDAILGPPVDKDGAKLCQVISRVCGQGIAIDRGSARTVKLGLKSKRGTKKATVFATAT